MRSRRRTRSGTAAGSSMRSRPASVAVSKRSGGMWAIEHLPERWHEAIRAADRAYDGEATSRDEAVLRETMAPFVAMVRERLPLVEPRPAGEAPRWGGY
jgi:Aminoglycoside adenylyltransferase, C-terminal domain